jgi:hypothetical protein
MVFKVKPAYETKSKLEPVWNDSSFNIYSDLFSAKPVWVIYPKYFE